MPAIIVFCAFTAEELETAHQKMLKVRNAFWKCLLDSSIAKVPQKFPPDIILIYLNGVCVSEKQEFRTSAVKYFAMKFPTMPRERHEAELEKAIASAQDEAVSFYIDETMK